MDTERHLKLLSLKVMHEQENADPALSRSRSGLCLLPQQ